MKRKILHILNTSSYSGAENVVITVINNMSGDYECAYVSIDGPIRNVLKKNEITFLPVDRMSIPEIHRITRLFKPDIIHAHDYTTSIIARMSTIHIPVISHLHNNAPWLKKIGLKSVVYGISCFGYKKILIVSDSIMNEYVFGKYFKSKTKVVGNPLNIRLIQEKATAFEPINVFDVIFLGRLIIHKNPIRFIKIIDKLRLKFPDIKVAMIGDGDLREECLKLIDQLNLKNTINLLGFIENPYPVLSKVKVLCMLSEWEGYGLAAAEALSLGVPVVAMPVGGLPVLINDSCGKLCDSDKLVIDEITLLLQDSSYLERKQKGAYKRASNLENIFEYMNGLELIYSKLGS